MQILACDHIMVEKICAFYMFSLMVFTFFVSLQFKKSEKNNRDCDACVPG